MLDNGAEVDRTEKKYGMTPLGVAQKKGHAPVVALLEEHLDSKFPLHAAAKIGDVEAMTQLLDGGAEVDAKKDGATPLLVACEKGHVDVVRLLLDKGAEVDRADKDGFTPLYVACQNGHVDAARLLLDKGAEVDRATENGWTPLLIACSKGHVDAARLLLDNGAEVDRATEEGRTPLDIAKRRRQRAVVALLEEHMDLKFPLHAAARTGDVDAMTQLIDGGTEVDLSLIHI